MLWFIFAILGAFFDATYYMLIKKFLNKINLYVLAGGAFLSTAIILLLISIINGIPKITPLFYPYVIMASFLLSIAIILNFKALKISDLSLTIPMLSFTPIFLILTSFILLKELPNLLGIIGIFLIVIGSYIININKSFKYFLDPFKEIFKNKGVFYMLIVAFLFSITSNLDKLLVQNSNIVFGHSVEYLLIGIYFLYISYKKHHNLNLYKKNLHKFFLVGGSLAMMAITINIAFTTQIVPYVISLKRLSILFSVFYGGLIFREKNIYLRILGALIMSFGVILIILS